MDLKLQSRQQIVARNPWRIVEIPWICWINEYQSGLSFWTFFIFLDFCCFLLNIAWPSLNLWLQEDPWEQRSWLRHYWPVVFPWVFISTFGLQLSTLLCEFFFWMVGKGGLISLKGSAPCHCQAFWRLLGLRGSCGCCGAPAAALACSSFAPAVGGIASSPAELVWFRVCIIIADR